MGRHSSLSCLSISQSLFAACTGAAYGGSKPDCKPRDTKARGLIEFIVVVASAMPTSKVRWARGSEAIVHIFWTICCCSRRLAASVATAGYTRTTVSTPRRSIACCSADSQRNVGVSASQASVHRSSENAVRFFAGRFATSIKSTAPSSRTYPAHVSDQVIRKDTGQDSRAQERYMAELGIGLHRL